MRVYNKYGNQKTTIDGHIFDSKAEAKYYAELKLLKRAGIVKEIELQPRFEIIPAYKHPETGKKVSATYYIADFKVTYADGRVEIVDVKGHKTAVYRLKKRLFESQYGLGIKEIS